jgi:hypothetical protein
MSGKLVLRQSGVDGPKVGGRGHWKIRRLQHCSQRKQRKREAFNYGETGNKENE